MGKDIFINLWGIKVEKSKCNFIVKFIPASLNQLDALKGRKLGGER